MELMTTREDIAKWFKDGQAKQATHMIVVCDDFDLEDYPVYVMPGQDVQQLQLEKYSGQNMQRTMEVYKLSAPMDEQLNLERCFRY